MMMCKKNENVAKWGKLLVALALLVTLAVPLWAQDWVWLLNNAAGEFYLNQRSVEDRGSYVIGWVRMDLSDAMKSSPTMRAIARVYGREPSYCMFLIAAQKGSKQSNMFQETVFDRNGNPIRSESESGQWEYCMPGTTDEAIWYALMLAAGIRF